ncbi:LysR substrate-binding domain-containing protein [Pseudoruegeria sp. HB172150]|uniref:LysR substrate-binding domain-containing protein n=1 Tax=Pseudoruegeria sp. HB172150 TaxID=2721164 RepID=UPI0015543956|nr:LysR substrate-binding domain-containing protein [Pseudoruegeria sp. HB172150]
MHKRQLPLNALRSFEVAARQLNFSAAATELGVTHGAVSRQISILEATLGLRLFVRGYPMSLTEDGQRLFEGIAPAFERIMTAMSEIEQGSPKYVVAVNAPPTFTIKWLIPRMSVFMRRHRNIDVRITTGTSLPAGGRSADVLIRRFGSHRVEFKPKTFLTGELVAVCAPELLEKETLRSPLDIVKFPLIEAATNPGRWIEWFRSAGLNKPADARFVHFEEMFLGLQAAMEGLGVALVPLPLVADDLAASRLVVPVQSSLVQGFDYGFHATPLGVNERATAAFVDWLSVQGEESNSMARSLVLSAFAESEA